MSVIEFWRWTPAWHWVLPALALAVLAAFIGARLVLAEEARRLDDVEWDTDWHREPVTEDDADQIIAEWHDDLPGPVPEGARDIGQSHRAGELHLEPWREHAWWDDPDLTVWDAKQQAARCWEIVHIEFPRLRAELGIAA